MFSPHEDNECTVKARSLFQQSVLQFRKNRFAVFGLIVIAALFIIALGTIAVDIATDNEFYNTHVINQDLSLRLAPPSAEHIFGCDEFGRDIFLRIIWGTKYSLFIGIGALILALAIGMPLGMISGYYGGKIDNFIMRIMDVILAVPFMLMALAIVAALGTSTINLLIALSVSNIARFSRIARASVMTVKDNEYIEAARAIGASDLRIMFRYVLPNSLAPNLVQVSLSIGDSILQIAGLSYLGLGVQPPTPEWGSLLTSAKMYMRDAWHISVFPGVFLIIAVIAFNLLGDGVRDALDPKLKR